VHENEHVDRLTQSSLESTHGSASAKTRALLADSIPVSTPKSIASPAPGSGRAVRRSQRLVALLPTLSRRHADAWTPVVGTAYR